MPKNHEDSSFPLPTHCDCKPNNIPWIQQTKLLIYHSSPKCPSIWTIWLISHSVWVLTVSPRLGSVWRSYYTSHSKRYPLQHVFGEPLIHRSSHFSTPYLRYTVCYFAFLFGKQFWALLCWTSLLYQGPQGSAVADFLHHMFMCVKASRPADSSADCSKTADVCLAHCHMGTLCWLPDELGKHFENVVTGQSISGTNYLLSTKTSMKSTVVFICAFDALQPWHCWTTAPRGGWPVRLTMLHNLPPDGTFCWTSAN